MIINVTLEQLDNLVDRLGNHENLPDLWCYKSFYESHNIDLVLENRQYVLKFPTDNDELVFRITYSEIL